MDNNNILISFTFEGQGVAPLKIHISRQHTIADLMGFIITSRDALQNVELDLWLIIHGGRRVKMCPDKRVTIGYLIDLEPSFRCGPGGGHLVCVRPAQQSLAHLTRHDATIPIKCLFPGPHAYAFEILPSPVDTVDGLINLIKRFVPTLQDVELDMWLIIHGGPRIKMCLDKRVTIGYLIDLEPSFRCGPGGGHLVCVRPAQHSLVHLTRHDTIPIMCFFPGPHAYAFEILASPVESVDDLINLIKRHRPDLETVTLVVYLRVRDGGMYPKKGIALQKVLSDYGLNQFLRYGPKSGLIAFVKLAKQ